MENITFKKVKDCEAYSVKEYGKVFPIIHLDGSLASFYGVDEGYAVEKDFDIPDFYDVYWSQLSQPRSETNVLSENRL